MTLAFIVSRCSSYLLLSLHLVHEAVHLIRGTESSPGDLISIIICQSWWFTVKNMHVPG
jgi:hypothetical protein